MSSDIKHKILCVDDEEGILKSLKRLLKTVDAEILLSNNGPEALEILKAQDISLIISDQRMPGMTGVELLTESTNLSPDTVRILLTGYADVESTAAAINSGAIKYYLNKPWDDDFLISRINESLDLYGKTKENIRLTELTAQQNKQLKDLNKNLDHKVKEQTMELEYQNEALSKSFMDTIKMLSTITEMRFKEVGSHSQRVASLVKKIAKHYDLEDNAYQEVVVASFLHDIGKIGLSDSILKKKYDDYSRKEIEEIEKHTVMGQSCVYSMAGFEEIGVVIRHHHENFDGSGYPDNLVSNRIPLGSRIIRIADSFDRRAFLHGYPDEKTLNLATAHLVENAGTWFDPEIIKVFVKNDIAKQFIYKDISDVYGTAPSELTEGMVVAQDVYSRSGMFLLPKGAKLSSGMVNRLRKIDKVDPIPNGVQVYKQNVNQEVESAAV